MSAAIRAAARLDPFASQQAFRALLSTIARPGSIVPHRLPHHEIPPGLLVPLALGDVNTTFHVAGEDRWTALVGDVTGSTEAEPPDADLVALLEPVHPEHLPRLRTGDDLRPEMGAKIGISCGLDATERRSQSVTLELTGPGVAGVETLEVHGHPPELFETLAGINASLPKGVDTWLISEHWIAALPRSASITVRSHDEEANN
jgi:alpha-D-ribose 1-methylphosphonate 5-triphosphate synthase subunit PhnH